MTLLAGADARSLELPPGVPMGAFPDRHSPTEFTPRIAAGTHDPPFARALALQSGEQSVVVLTLDVCLVQWPEVDHLRRVFHERTGVPAARLLVHACHNHSGPECTRLFKGDPDAPHLQRMWERATEAACQAWESLRPARASVGEVIVDRNFNRRQGARLAGTNPAREARLPVDPKVRLLALDTVDDEPLATVLGFAAHPVMMDNPNRLWTAEYPGVVARELERRRGGVGMFWQGAAGNLHNYGAHANDWNAVEAEGVALVEAGLDTSLRPLGGGLRFARWAAEPLRRGSDRDLTRLEIAVLHLDQRTAIAFWPGEPFVELALQCYDLSPYPATWVCGYTHGWAGYIPHRPAFDEGGYGVDFYALDEPRFSRTQVTPGTGERLVSETVALLGFLRRG